MADIAPDAALQGALRMTHPFWSFCRLLLSE